MLLSACIVCLLAEIAALRSELRKIKIEKSVALQGAFVVLRPYATRSISAFHNPPRATHLSLPGAFFLAPLCARRKRAVRA